MISTYRGVDEDTFGPAKAVDFDRQKQWLIPTVQVDGCFFALKWYDPEVKTHFEEIVNTKRCYLQ